MTINVTIPLDDAASNLPRTGLLQADHMSSIGSRKLTAHNSALRRLGGRQARNTTVFCRVAYPRLRRLLWPDECTHYGAIGAVRLVQANCR